MIIAEKFYAQEELKAWNETRKLQLCQFICRRTGGGTQSLLPPTAVPPACRRRASIHKLTKLQLSSFIPRFELLLSVEFLCNYHAIWAQKLEIMQ